MAELLHQRKNFGTLRQLKTHLLSFHEVHCDHSFSTKEYMFYGAVGCQWQLTHLAIMLKLQLFHVFPNSRILKLSPILKF